MRNKKGFLLGEETVKIIISVIVIGFLIYFLLSLYFKNAKEHEFELAKEVLVGNNSGSFKLLIDQARDSPDGFSEEFFFHNPGGWHFFGFLFTEKKPNSCVGKSCVCICDSVYFENLPWDKDRQLKECDEEGICLEVEDLGRGGINIEIEENTRVVVTKEKGDIFIGK